MLVWLVFESPSRLARSISLAHLDNFLNQAGFAELLEEGIGYDRLEVERNNIRLGFRHTTHNNRIEINWLTHLAPKVLGTSGQRLLRLRVERRILNQAVHEHAQVVLDLRQLDISLTGLALLLLHEGLQCLTSDSDWVRD